ncbi:MAG TPA: TonB-dependent receptor, partial [Candidatus Latescibacteria bacterium]|nr:TonB-dependent receptor [Candidatus Latescibacterota bacterium]
WIDQIVVTATRMERVVKDLSATVSVVTSDDIEASNVNSCTDILNTLPGVFVHKTGAFGRADVEIRGLGGRGRKVMVLVDGRPVKMGLFGCTVTHSLPLDNVERIEVVRGSLSVLYGSDALGGVINIITRKPTKPVQVDYTFSYGSFDTYVQRLRAGGVKGRLSLYATADKRKSRGHLPNSSYDGSDYTLRMGYKVSEDLEAVLSCKYFKGYKEEPLKANSIDTVEVWNDYERGALDLSLSGRIKGWELMAKVYKNLGEHEFSDGWHSRDFVDGAIIHGSGRPFSGNTLTAGFEFRRQGGKSFNWPKGKWDKREYAIFLHDEQLFGRTIFTLGGRYNYDDVSGGSFCPQVGLVVHVNEGASVRASINKGFRSPQINELYMFPPHNEDLKPEEVWNYELGLSGRIKGVEAELVGYRMKGKRMIKLEKNPNPPPKFKFQNTGSFDFKGIELNVRARMAEGLLGTFSYTYLDPGDMTKGRPGDKLDMSLTYNMRKLSLSIKGQYVWDYFAADGGEQRIPNYFVADAKLSYELLPGFLGFLAVDSIFDTDYKVYADLPGGKAGLYRMPGRAVTVGLSLKL